jgi:Ethanolamine utilization protein EutJ (predicted chaperonin)
MTSPSADTMERARALRSAVVWASNEAVEIIAQALHDAQEEARREQREKDAAEIEARAECFNPGWVRTVLEGLAYRFRNRESSP